MGSQRPVGVKVWGEQLEYLKLIRKEIINQTYTSLGITTWLYHYYSLLLSLLHTVLPNSSEHIISQAHDIVALEYHMMAQAYRHRE